MRVLVHHSVRERLERATRECAHAAEMGGILLGAYRGPHLEITALTDPATGDERQLYSFIRADPAHQVSATQAWMASGNTHTYVGEWHTHPWGAVCPSSTDTRSWRREVKRNQRAMAFALAVPGDWGVFVVRPRFLWSILTRLHVVESGEVGVVFGAT
jgi:integrative and conjugative element protein (TIGR02256 family)